jgi:hypothetical protein
MFNKIFFRSILLLLIFFSSKSFAQQRKDTLILKSDSTSAKKFDSSSKKNILALDTSAKKYNPKVATFRSAVLPGWGQAYNKKYWKIPIIYGALGTTAYVFFYNLKTYKLLKQAVILRSDNDPTNDSQVDPQFINLSTESIRSYRNSYRQNIDYSVLFFIAFWGLNVVDATVDAHLKSFDVSNDLSLKIKVAAPPGNSAGVSFILAFKDKNAKVLSSPR